MVQTRYILGAAFVAALVAACGGGSDGTKSQPSAAALSEKEACDLVTQEEVDGIFEAPVGPGTNETLERGSRTCSWLAGDQTKLVLQVETLMPDVTRAVDLRDVGYTLSEVPGMSGPAAIAVVPTESGQEETVALLALSAGNWTLTINPFQLRVKTGTERFERLKAMLENAAGRL